MIKTSWSDLFTIGLVQRQTLLPLTSVVSANLMHLIQNTGCPSAKLMAMADHVSKLGFLIGTMENLALDDMEFATLKALALCSSGKYLYSLLHFSLIIS
jgi:hypothetical protein